MSSRHYLFVTGAGFALPEAAAAQVDCATPRVDPATRCAFVHPHDSERIEITQDQWRFLRGIYAMNPEAAPGLPRGDDAVLAKGSGNSSGLLFFVDGDRPCTPVPAPPALLRLMERVAQAG